MKLIYFKFKTQCTKYTLSPHLIKNLIIKYLQQDCLTSLMMGRDKNLMMGRDKIFKGEDNKVVYKNSIVEIITDFNNLNYLNALITPKFKTQNYRK